MAAEPPPSAPLTPPPAADPPQPKTTDAAPATSREPSTPIAQLESSRISTPADAPRKATTTTSQPIPAATPPQARISTPSVVVHRLSVAHHAAKQTPAPPPPPLPPTPDDPDASGSSTTHPRPAQTPWARILLAVAVCGPALVLGGVPTLVVPAFLAVVLLLWLRLCTRCPERLRVPYGAAIGAFSALLTLFQWVPLPDDLRTWLAPDLIAMTTAALAGSGVTAWPSISPVPGDSALEAARLLGLTALFIAAAQLSWRVSASLVAGLGSFVALLGLAQAGFGVRKIYGFYQPADVDPSQTVSLLTSFVNANHQSGLFLLGIFCAAALAVYHRMAGQQASEPSQATKARERSLAALAALAVQGVAMVLSLSRGAMSALVLVAPIALWLAWRRERSDNPPSLLWLRRLALVGGFLVVGTIVARQSGAWAELATLSRATEAGVETKFRVADEATDLIALSPIVGIGRGAFIDLFPAIDSRPVGVVHTHLESAPVAMVVEWGPPGGALITLGLLWWWIAAVYSSGGRHGRPRRIALCGPLALAIHSLGDFSLEFLGVAAPLCALAGSLSERQQVARWRATRAARLGGLVLVSALALAVWAVPHTWQRRPREDLSERTVTTADLQTRPLDGDLHTALAFRAAESGEWEQTRARALVAARLHPDAADPWWLLTNAEHALGRTDASAVALARMLAVVRKPLPVPVAQALRQRYPNAEELATYMPTALAPWTLVMESIIPLDPAYASILAAARNQVDGHEPAVLRLQVRIALDMQNPTLARYHTTLLRQLAPDQVISHLLHVLALRAFLVPREREIQSVLEETLRDGRITDPAEVALLEDALVESLLREATPESRTRAREFLKPLLTRPGDRAALQRRNAYKQQLDAD